jgi:tetratricopeptide (TPR) repeat protein
MKLKPRRKLTMLWMAHAAWMVTFALPFAEAQGSELVEADKALREGRYSEAIEAYTDHLDEEGSALRAYRGLIAALDETGRYQEAESRVKEFKQAHPDSSELDNLLGEILYETGRLESAEEAFEGAVAGGASDLLTAELNLAVAYFERGEREEALRRFDRFIDVYNSSPSLSSEALTAVATACRYLGGLNPQLFKDALKAFDEAVAADRGNLEPRLRAGELFLEKYNSTDAQETFKEILTINPTHPRALLGMAQVLHFDGSPEALDLVHKALEVNSNLVPARAFAARLELELENYEVAAREAEAALEVNPQSFDALSILAAARFLKGDRPGFDEAEARVFARNPRHADFYNTLADLCVQNRLYQQAADFARHAIELDEKSWRGYGLVGLNQLRLGLMEEGRNNLELSFEGDPYNVQIKNTLDLVDTFPDYLETQSDRFLVVVDSKESELLAPFVVSIAEEAYDHLATRYRYRPPTPIRVEVYPSHADFSVRTIGLAGLGALGVCFGPVVAIDSPSARKIGEFNWASTLWHELMHTVSLGATDNKVPRWFSEGLSVYEERKARPGWGDDASVHFLIALKQGKLLPIASLNNGFIRPSFPQQIGISYYQASLICDLIERDHGFDAILDMLAGYRLGMGTAEIFEKVLECDTECFDEKLDAYMKELFATPLAAIHPSEEEHPNPIQILSPRGVRAQADAAPQDFGAQLAAGIALFKEEDYDGATTYLERAKRLYPGYGGNDSPYWFLAQIYKKQGKEEKAAEALTQLVSINERHYQAHIELAAFLESSGEKEKATEILERALYIYPFESSVHRDLASLYRGQGRYRDVILARGALVALEPVDRAQVLYELALAYYEAGDPAGARRELLRALEIAPTFGEALELLLKCQPEPSGGQS